ncbi:hypothetical protein ACTMNS_07705 [Staphylococcus haemolyticus]
MVQFCLSKDWCLTPKPNNLDRRFRIYRETLSRFSCAASDMSAPRFDRVNIKNIELDEKYRVTMTDYCYRNYRQYLEDESILHSTYDRPMSSLIAEKLNQPDYYLKLDSNFSVAY